MSSPPDSIHTSDSNQIQVSPSIDLVSSMEANGSARPSPSSDPNQSGAVDALRKGNTSSPSNNGYSSPPSRSNVHTPDSGQVRAPPSMSSVSSPAAHEFARPPPDFDPNQLRAALLVGHGQGLLNPADAGEESIEDEIARQIAESEAAGKTPLTDDEKERIARTIRHIREGGWLRRLKLQLVGNDTVPIEYFNRLVAEHEGTIPKVARINAMASRKVAKRDALIASLKDELRQERLISQSLEQQKIDMTQDERANKNEIIALREENKNLIASLKGQEKDSDDLRSQIAELEVGQAKCGANDNSTLKDENNRLNDAAASQGEPTDLEDLRRQISELKAQLAERDNTISTLETRPAQVSNPSNEELQARCKDLREARDHYRERWARKITAGNAGLVEFWEAVENTREETNLLYYGIEKLSHALGLAEGVLDTPKVLDKIIAQVTASVNEVLATPQVTIVNLRTANLLAQVKIETLRRQLDKAELGRSEDEIRAQLGVVDEEEVERRVSLRTQAYRLYRGTLLDHVFNARTEFLALAERSFDRGAIEALVDRFLEPTSLPRVKSPTGLARP
ncbi:hypothetical protein F5X97DRAFT_128991 [Nemania serpens]|nr:hypothetical protein F5X97DRAFT_128991 [Nemania serpens]